MLLEKSVLVSEGLPGLKEASKVCASMRSADGKKGRKGRAKGKGGGKCIGLVFYNCLFIH